MAIWHKLLKWLPSVPLYSAAENRSGIVISTLCQPRPSRHGGRHPEGSRGLDKQGEIPFCQWPPEQRGIPPASE
jgi:hypothetical protein